MLVLPDDLPNDPASIEANGTVRYSSKIVARVGVLLSIYFLDGHKFDKKRALRSILAEYTSLFGDKINTFHRPDSNRLTKWAGKDIPEYYEKSLVDNENRPYYFMMRHYDAKEKDDPSLWSIRASAKAKQDLVTPLSGLKVHFPPAFVFDNSNRFIDLITRWCDLILPVHGSCGLGDLTNAGEEIYEAWHYPLLKRYPGLEYDSMGSFFALSSEKKYDRPRSSNWITIIGRHNVEQLDEENIQALPPEVRRVKFKGGYILCAGHLPTLGDVYNGGIPQEYSAVSRLLRPIRFEDYKFGIFKVPEGLNGRDETINWLHRFDGD